MSEKSERPRGRPRKPELDRRILDAARDLLGSEGFSATTIHSVARRAGVPATAIYRRWPSRMELIEEAMFPGFDDVAVEPTGDLHQDLSRFVDAYYKELASPAVQAAMPVLVSKYHSEKDIANRRVRGWRTARPQFRAILEAAPRAAVDQTLDPDAIFDLLLGAIVFRVFFLPLGDRAAAPDQTVALICRVLEPRVQARVPRKK